MAGGRDLLGGESAPRKRGRPKGSGNRRPKDLKGFIDARFGGSAAQQSAALCMVTPAELKAAGGSMAKAQVSKALELVRHVRDAKDRLDEELRELVRQAVDDLAERRPGAGAQELRALVTGFVNRINQLGGDFGLPQAMKLLADERAALLPYTDQRQPQAVEAIGDGFRPAVVVMGGGVDLVGVSPAIEGQVSRVRSHDESQALDFVVLPAPEPSAGE